MSGFVFVPFPYQQLTGGRPDIMSGFLFMDEQSVERWLGRREAFAAVAGGCWAAQAEALRRLRDEKGYRKEGLTWDDFCKKRVGVSRRQVDRTLSLLEEFGPAYFHVAQMAHVTAEEYRAIAPHVSPEGVRLDGAVVALLPENSEQVSAAVAELLTREKPEKPKTPPSFEAVVKRCEALACAIAELGSLDEMQ
jgi:hypothetical protein